MIRTGKNIIGYDSLTWVFNSFCNQQLQIATYIKNRKLLRTQYPWLASTHSLDLLVVHLINQANMFWHLNNELNTSSKAITQERMNDEFINQES